jgi:hypothetical protein
MSENCLNWSELSEKRSDDSDNFQTQTIIFRPSNFAKSIEYHRS